LANDERDTLAYAPCWGAGLHENQCGSAFFEIGFMNMLVRGSCCGLLCIVSLAAHAVLPGGWSDVDIGSPAIAGSSAYTNGVWTVTGGGADIWNNDDQFTFCSNGMSGNGVIIGYVVSQTGSDPWSQAGVMLRNDTTAGATQASVLITPGNGVTFRYRVSAGGVTAQTFVAGVTAPVWTRLSRSNDVFSASYSIDGVNWTEIGSPQTIAMNSNALAGLAVTAHNNSLSNTALFRNVLAVPGAQVGVPAGLINPYIGSTPFAGETTWPLPQNNVAGNALTPRMGWNSWFVVGDATGPSENLITNTATSLVAEGLAAAGYKTVTIDCTWIASGRGYRDGNGDLIVDPTRWPDGMEYVADYVHAQGLLMGGYTDIGASGYGSPAQIGGFGYYQQDADQYAAWGWDFIKIDDHGPGDFNAAANAIANNDVGRPVVISLSTPQVDGLQFATRIANSFRVNNDIAGLSGSVAWSSILLEFDTAQADWYAEAPGHFLDPDMLMVGFNGISDIEGRSQFNLWCILGAPLMIGTDVRPVGGALAPAITATTINTLTNAEVIAVDQDPLCAVGVPVASGTAVYAKPLDSFVSGQFAVLLLNRSSTTNSFTVNWSDLGLIAGSAAAVRDLWGHVDLGYFTSSYTATNLPPHASVMLKITGIFDWNRPRTYEAESAYNSYSGTAYYVSHNQAFSSGAFVTGVGLGSGNSLQFNNVMAPSNDLYEVDLYYAGSVNRTAQLSVNGATSTNISFPATGSDTNSVGAVAVYIPLLEGENTLGFSNATNLAPNFDKIVVSLGTPAGFSASAGDGSVKLSWNTPASGVTFNLYRGASSGEESFLAGGLATTNYSDTAVTNGVTYFYVVTENNAALGGESPPSAEVSAKPQYATTSLAFSSAVRSNNPVAYWRFSETNGSTAGDSIGGYNGTYGAAVLLGGAGPRPPDFLGFETSNTAAQFIGNATNSWITIPALNLNTNTMTIAAWIYPIGNQADYSGLVFCRSGSTVAGMNYNSAGTELGYTWNNKANTWGWNSGLLPPANQWSFVVLVVDPSNAILYLINPDGQQSATNDIANSAQAFAGTGTIGTDKYSPVARVFNGLMDEVEVYNYALAPAQIQQLYANGHELSQVLVGAQPSGTTLNLSWSQGTLLQSTNLAGPWLRAANTASPFTVTPTNAAEYFRVLLQ
jgi:hypothetical protein